MRLADRLRGRLEVGKEVEYESDERNDEEDPSPVISQRDQRTATALRRAASARSRGCGARGGGEGRCLRRVRRRLRAIAVQISPCSRAAAGFRRHRRRGRGLERGRRRAPPGSGFRGARSFAPPGCAAPPARHAASAAWSAQRGLRRAPSRSAHRRRRRRVPANGGAECRERYGRTGLEAGRDTGVRSWLELALALTFARSCPAGEARCRASVGAKNKHRSCS